MHRRQSAWVAIFGSCRDDSIRMPGEAIHDSRTIGWRYGAGLLAALTIAAYLPALRGTFIWDDSDYILNNLSLRSIGGLWRIWTDPAASPQYYPLVFSSFWFEYHLWGATPFGYHAVNLLLHIGSALLIWRIVDQLDLPGGWLAAAIFALHPVHVESVAWISERKNVFSMLFYLLTLHVYLQPFTRRRWTTALLLFIAALLSKSVTATWPAAVLVIFWWRDGRVTRRDLLRLLPFFALGIAAGLWTSHIEHSLVGASASRIAELNFSIADRFLIAGRAVWFYGCTLVVPIRLSFIYPRWVLDAHDWTQWCFPASVVVVMASLLLAARRGPGRNGLAATLLFVGSLFPALGFVNVYPMRYSFVADHFQYLASVALLVPIAVLLARYLGKAAAIVLLPLIVLSFLRAGVFAGPLALWSDTYGKNPNSWMVCTNLANALNAAQQTDAAGDLYLRAYELSPDLYETQTNAAIVLARRGLTAKALSLLNSSAQLKPDFPITFFYWGMVLENSGDLPGAVEQYRRAIQLSGTFPAAEQRLNSVRFRLGPASTQGSGDAARQ